MWPKPRESRLRISTERNRQPRSPHKPGLCANKKAPAKQRLQTCWRWRKARAHLSHRVLGDVDPPRNPKKRKTITNMRLRTAFKRRARTRIPLA
jgi:hypothetical protein